MGFFSKGKTESLGEKKAVQEVAMRTMQQDLGVAKRGELTGQTKLESVERHKGNSQPEKTIARVAPPVAPVALPHLAEMEHKREKPVLSDVPEIKIIPIAPVNSVNAPADVPTPPSKSISRPFSSESMSIARPAEISRPESVGRSPIFSRPSVPLPPTKPESQKIQIPTKDKEMTVSKSRFNPPKVDQTKKKFSINKKKAMWGLVGGIAIIAIAIGVYFVVIPMFFTPNPSIVVTDNQKISDIPETTIIPELPDISNVPEIIENDFKLISFDIEYDIDVNQDEFIDYYQNNLVLAVAGKLNAQDLALAQDFVDIQFSLDQDFPSAEMIVNGIFNEFPQDILDRMTSKYNLVAYSEGGSGRLGLILEINDTQAVQEILLGWEQTMTKELVNLYLDNSLNFENASSESFIENIYSGVSIKYVNFPFPDSALEYAIAGNKLIFSTSKNSMFTLIDRVNNGNNAEAEIGDDVLNEENNQ